VTGMTAFLDALAFLTRLAPARACSPAAIGRSVPFFAPAGLALGAICTTASCFVQSFLASRPAFEAANPLDIALSALFWLGLEIWLTRGLHWDGLADLTDAAGAPSPRFWEVLKDSRLGVFGALSLFLVFCGQWSAVSWHLAAGHLGGLVIAPAWGRACAVWLAASVHPRDLHSIGGLVRSGVCAKTAVLYAIAASGAVFLLCGLGWEWWQGLTLLLVQYGLTRAFVRLAREKGGFSGDFLGAAIELGQLWFLLAVV